MQEDFAAALLGSGSHRFPERLQVYRNNVFVSLTQALAAVYPVLVRLVGEDYFGQAARRFIRQHPSRSGNLHDFGRELAGFLARLPEAGSLPYLADVAALEWAWHEAFHAADAPPLDAARLAAMSEEEVAALRFRLHPAARLVASRYPVLAIWETNQEGAPAEGEVCLDAGADWLLIARRSLARTIERLTPGEHALLAALGSGAPLAEACEAAAAASPDIDLEAAMARFVADQVLVQLY
jgi:hypothetical protein